MDVLLRKLKDAGLEEKEQYGFIIRLTVKENKGMGSYHDWVVGSAKIQDDMIDDMKERSKVTDKTLEQAKKYAESIMKNSVKKKKAKGELLEVESVFFELQKLQEPQKEAKRSNLEY